MNKMQLLQLLLVVFLAGCSSIDRSGRIAGARLESGVSTKKELIDRIGLPNAIERRDGLEYWIYQGKPAYSSFFIPIPVASAPVSASASLVYYTSIQPTLQQKSPDLVCVVDAEGK
jgi:hypothetical protein